ncbi:MAG TPA: outer membrane lipoprotein carrier protein LolA [Sphingomonadaceae bacterium]|nr:outer membrane lipoprotein carrier protein LolA [Sphingomonadaceae bacterium]
MLRPYLFAIAAPLAVTLAAPAVLAAAPDPLAQVSQHLRAVTTMTADFTQTDRAGKVLTGTLTLKRPGHIRFQYQKGVPLLIVGDGKALIMIDYSVKQVSRWPIGNSPLSVLLDPNRDLGRFAHVVPGNDPGLLLVEGKDPKHPEFGTITIAFARVAGAPGGLELRGWTVLDAQNNRSSVRLSNTRFNVPVEDRMFRWTDPRTRRPVR